MVDAAWLKLALLADGLTPTSEFSNWFATTNGYVRRRNFYNNPNWTDRGATPPPQEIRLASGPPITVAVNDYGRSRWRLTWNEDVGPAIEPEGSTATYPVELIADLQTLLFDDALSRQCNLYGGSALSFFSPRSCYFFVEGTQCRFCSLGGTAKESADFAGQLQHDQVATAVAAALDRDPGTINQIMIVGGNERDLDRGFRNQVRLVRAAAAAVDEAGLSDEVSVHLIVMPPNNLGLIDQLSDVPNLHVGFNIEVWDSTRFQEIAPGKHLDYGRSAMLAALHHLRDVVGPYRAHSILIAGLEPAELTIDGARWLAEEGISPILNVYHSDRHSSIGLSIRPTYRQLVNVATGAQELHDAYPIKPYWKGCGRNALDYEAAQGLFRGDAPDLG